MRLSISDVAVISQALRLSFSPRERLLSEEFDRLQERMYGDNVAECEVVCRPAGGRASDVPVRNPA